MGADARLFGSVCVGVCACALLAPAGCTGGEEAPPPLTGRQGKAGKQDATLTQETGAIGDCLHCYPINRP